MKVGLKKNIQTKSFIFYDIGFYHLYEQMLSLRAITRGLMRKWLFRNVQGPVRLIFNHFSLFQSLQCEDSGVIHDTLL